MPHVSPEPDSSAHRFEAPPHLTHHAPSTCNCGQILMRYVNEIVTLDDTRCAIRLQKRCPQLLFGFGARQSFIMPERLASKPGTEQVTDPVGSGLFRFLRDEWVSGVSCTYAKFDDDVPRNEPP